MPNDLTSEDLEYFRSLLEALRDQLRETKEFADDAAKVVELDQARFGRLSRMGDLQAQAISVALNRRRDVQLQRIKGAFQRMEEGTYGDCLACGTAIDRERLEIDPTAFQCVACAEAAEKRKR
jgi:DnaK suppressor protein